MCFFSDQASPQPDIMWMKDSLPVTKQTIITNCDGSSQMLILSSERSDSGIYSVLLRNLVGQETFSTEVRVTGKPIHFYNYIDSRIQQKKSNYTQRM